MPLIAALVLGLGSFFGYTGTDVIQTQMQRDNASQQHWLALKASNTAKVAAETLNQKLEVVQ